MRLSPFVLTASGVVFLLAARSPGLAAPPIPFDARTVSADFAGASSTFAADIDKDGDLDVLATARVSGQVGWFENGLAQGAPWAFHPVDGDFPGASNARAVDLDDDGDLDIVATAHEGDEVAWWENGGDGLTWNRDIIAENLDGAIAVRFGDMDGDGKVDVIASGFMNNDIIWFENRIGESPDPTPTPEEGETPAPGPVGWKPNAITTEFAGVRSFEVIDMDGDGDLDVPAVGRYANELRWFENLGFNEEEQVYQWASRLVVEDFYYAEALSLADVDGDGDVDLLGASRMKQDIAWFENLGVLIGDSTISWEDHKVEGKYEDARGIAAGDLDGDGAVDVLGVSPGTERLTWWHNDDGDGSDWDEALLLDSWRGGPQPELADIDGDGFKDILTTSPQGNRILWLRNGAGIDADGDGYSLGQEDCDDANPGVNPGAVEVCGDGIDNDCDDGDADCTPTLTPTPGVTSTLTPTPGVTPTLAPTPTSTGTPVQTPTSTPTPILTEVPTPTASESTPLPTADPTASPTSDGTPTSSPTPEPTPTATAPGTKTPTASDPTATATPTAAPTEAPTGTPTATAAPTAPSEGSPTPGGDDPTDTGCACSSSEDTTASGLSVALGLLLLLPLRRRGKRPGAPKAAASLFASGLALLTAPTAFADVVINEAVSQPAGDGSDWVELYNSGDSEIDVSGWSIRDAQDGAPHPDDDHRYILPGETTIPAGGFLVLERDEDTGFDFGLGSEDGVFLFDGGDALVDETTWRSDEAEDGESWGRYPDGSGDFQTLLTPTQGAPNTLEFEPTPDPSDYIFNDVIRTWDLQIDDEDWEWLQANETMEVYVPGTLTFEDEVYEPVGVRYKGSVGALYGCFDDAGNQICDKLSMKVSFNKFVDGGRFYGLKKAQFHAMENDPTKMRERMGYALFRDFGVEGARTTYAQLDINDAPFGLYLMVEHIDSEFTRYHFEDGGGGNLYKEVWPLHSEPDEYIGALETNRDDPDVSTMIDFAAAIEEADDESAAAMLETWQDIDHQMRFLAVDRAIENQDGIMAWWCFGPWCSNHNFYWYEDRSDKMWLIPWDLDHSMRVDPWAEEIEGWPYWYEETATCRPMTLWWPIGFLPPACDPLTNYWGNALWDRYLEASDELLETLFTDENLQGTIDGYNTLLGPLIEADPVIDAEEWQGEVDQFREDIVIIRQKFVDSLVRDGDPRMSAALE